MEETIVADQDGSKDKWGFKKDSKKEWRWIRVAPNGETVGAAHEGYKNKKDCQANAKRNGWPGSVDYIIDEMTAKKVFED